MAHAGSVGNLKSALVYTVSIPIETDAFMTYTHCPHCGTNLPERGNFCPTCGHGIRADGDAMPSVDPNQQPAPPPLTPQDPLILERLGAGGWGFWPAALGLLALVPTAILVSLLALLIPLSTTTVVASVILAMFQFCLVWILTTRSWPVLPSLYGFRRPIVAHWRVAVTSLFALGGSLGAIQLYVMAATYLGLDILVPAELPTDLLLPGALSIVSIIALAVVTPLAEETFFRGFVLRGMVNRWGVTPGIILSAVVFAGLHFQPAIIIPVFITGLLLGALYWQTGSIWPGIGVHAAQNLIATLGIIIGL